MILNQTVQHDGHVKYKAFLKHIHTRSISVLQLCKARDSVSLMGKISKNFHKWWHLAHKWYHLAVMEVTQVNEKLLLDL